MALWKETTQNDQNERLEQEPVPVSPIPPRTEIPPKRSLSKPSQESIFGPGVVIEGKIEGDGDVRMAGQFKGDIHIKGDLNIEKGAHIAAKISARTITIEGELEGNIVASVAVKLLESGQVIGDLKAKTLTVAAGARMRGTVEFGWDDSPAVKLASVRAVEKAKPGLAV